MQNMKELYEEYSSTVYKYLFCLTHSEDISEDLTQETFAIAVKEIDKFKGECKISVWLCQIAKHLWYQKLKKKSKEKTISLSELDNDIDDIETIEESVLKREEKIQFFKDIRKLDNDSREVVYLRMIGNLNFIEIGDI